MANNPSARNNQDIEDLENAFNKLSDNKRKSGPKYAKQASSPVTTILVIAICVLAIAAIIGGILIFNMNNKNVIKADSTVLGISMKGLSRDEAAKELDAAFDKQYGDKTIEATIDGQTLIFSPTTLGAKLDSDKLIKTLLEAGKTAPSIDLSQYILLDQDALNAALEDFSPNVSATVKQHQVSVSGTAPTDYSKIDEAASQVLTIKLGTPGIKLETDVLLDQIREAFITGSDTISYTCPQSEPDPIDWNGLKEEYCVDAKSANIDPKTFRILDGTFGYGFDITEAEAEVNKANYGDEISVDFTWTEPEVTIEQCQEELNKTLFQDELATYTTKAGSQGNRDTNIELASAAINGTILYPGDVFSYNEIVGERTTEKGYKPGATYVGGQTVMSVGGGICQVSTTLYYCTIVADLEVVERECHAYPSSYTPLSTDATVFWGGIDYKFRNNTNYPIRIDAFSDNGDVTVTLYGTDEKDYYVEFDYVHLATYPYDVIYEEYPADNPQGYKDGQVLTSPYTGYKSEGWQIKYDKVTGEEIERVKVSTDVYSTRDKVVVKIVGGEEEGEGGGESGGTEGGSESGGTEGGGESGGTEGGGESGGTEGGGESGGTEGGGESGGSEGGGESGGSEGGGESGGSEGGGESGDDSGSNPIELPMISG